MVWAGIRAVLTTIAMMPAMAFAQAVEAPPPPQQRPPTITEICALLPDDEAESREDCRADAKRREEEQRRREQAAAEKERPRRSSFLRWMHLDGMWMPTSSSGSGTYGLVGAHVTVANLGRVNFFGPPGVMLLMWPGEHGDRRFQPALTWGFSIRLIDFRFPGATDNARLFANLAKCWTGTDSRLGLDMAGLSLTWKN